MSRKHSNSLVVRRYVFSYLTYLEGRCVDLELDFTSVLYIIASRILSNAEDLRISLGDSLFFGGVD